MIQLHAAPVQGHTDAAWRHFHQIEYAAATVYCTPFLRVEKGEPQPRGLRDFASPLTVDSLEGQVIFRDMAELSLLVSALHQAGARRINLNMGCPFPLQTGKGRGAALLARADALRGLDELMASYGDTAFSVKMRLGYDDPSQWRQLMPMLNTLPLAYIAVHPRTARQQYGGELHLDQFAALLAESARPVVFNGEIHTPADIAEVCARYQAVSGVMAGRGLLARPSLFEEYARGEELPPDVRLSRMLRLHDSILAHYSATLCGDSQILSKIKSFWEYAEPEIGHKPHKAIRKVTSIAKYRQAVALVR